MKQFLFALIVIAVQATIGSAQLYGQRAVLFEGKGCTGEYVVVPQTYVADLGQGQYNFDNRAVSVQVTGIWVFYTNKDYNTGQTSGVEYVFGVNAYCTDLMTIRSLTSSARFVGSPNDYRTDSITFFQDTYFQGNEEFTYGDLPNMNLVGNHKSLVVTGAAAWTVYDQPNYVGNALCIYPPQSNDYTPYLLPDVATISIPHGTIKSVRKGCWNKNKASASYSLSEFARSGGISASEE